MDTNEPGRVYGQDQINKRYGVKNQATIDPFLAMPTYSQRFTKQERSLPDLASRPFAKEFFPRELHETLEGADGPGGAKRRKMNKKTLALSNITSLRTAEEIFLPEAAQQELADAEGQNKALQLLDKINDGEGGVDNIDLEDDDDWVQSNNVGDGDDDDAAEDSDQYDDESGDDYNAEQYFEENQPDDDYGDGDGGGEDFF
jgi:DNA-directed RNA polymerase III subunit RPC7